MRDTLQALRVYLDGFVQGTPDHQPFTAVISDTGLTKESSPSLRKHSDIPVLFLVRTDGVRFEGELVITVEASTELEVMQTASLFVNVVQPLLDALKAGKLISGNSRHRSHVQMDFKALPANASDEAKVQIRLKGMQLDHLRKKPLA